LVAFADWFAKYFHWDLYAYIGVHAALVTNFHGCWGLEYDVSLRKGPKGLSKHGHPISRIAPGVCRRVLLRRHETFGRNPFLDFFCNLF
jgi:hypothetical protein